MSDLRNQIIQEHIDGNYPNARIVNYYDTDSGLSFYTAEQLQDVDGDWFPLSCYRDPHTGKVVYGGRSKVVHTYTEGETGAGKTTRFVIQAIRALSSMKGKPSFVLVDIHGEIIENLYTHLQKNGYKIRILNCDDPSRSDTYNPFAELVEECLKTRSLTADSINKIRRISEIMQPVESTQDPIWDMGARSYTNGCILDKFEDLIAGDLPPSCMTIYNIIQHHHWLRNVLRRYGSDPLFRIPHYAKKGHKALSVQKIISVTDNAERTRKSYFGVVENHYDTFGQPSLYSLSSSNNIDISDFMEEPTVIVIQSGNTKIGDDLISLLMNEIYTAVVKVGKANARKKLPRKIHCFLDEFANCNIADGPEYVKMLTTSRKFGMYWHMILQCDAQLDRKYDANIGRIIRANSTEIFMGSHDYETKARFARSCGQKTIESLGSRFSQQIPSLDVVDLMTIERLDLTSEGYAYIKSNKQPLLKAYFEAFFCCEEFVPVENIDQVYPVNHYDYTQTAFLPDEIPEHLKEEEYQVLMEFPEEAIELKKLLEQLSDRWVREDAITLLMSLAEKHMIKLMEEGQLKRALEERRMQLLAYRYQHGIKEAAAAVYIGEESEDPEEDNPFDYSPRPTRRSPRRRRNFVKEWFDEALEEGSKPLARALKEHILLCKKEIDYEAVMRRSTAVPEVLRELFSGYYLNEEIEEEEYAIEAIEERLPTEILEDYIKSNDFETLPEWIEKLKSERQLLENAKAFPAGIMDCFAEVIKTFENELTIENVRTVKRLLDGEEED